MTVETRELSCDTSGFSMPRRSTAMAFSAVLSSTCRVVGAAGARRNSTCGEAGHNKVASLGWVGAVMQCLLSYHHAVCIQGEALEGQYGVVGLHNDV